MENKITLRPFQDSDLPLYKDWLYRPHVARWYHHPLDWLAEAENRDQEFCWLHHFIVEHEAMPIGFCQYYDYADGEEDWHGSANVEGAFSIDYLIGEPALLRRGFGKVIISSLIHKIRPLRGAKRIIVQPEPENAASCNTLLSCGFILDAQNGIYVMVL